MVGDVGLQDEPVTAPPRHRVVPSPLGDLVLVARGDALTALQLPGSDHARVGPADATGVLDVATTQLDEYFDGRRTAFEGVRLAPAGTSFQRRVWAELLLIPHGQTRSYGQVAQHVGGPRTTRAVGLANGANPLAILVPCHRVIGADGGLVGYAGGLSAKRRLLDLEAGSRTLFDT